MHRLSFFTVAEFLLPDSMQLYLEKPNTLIQGPPFPLAKLHLLLPETRVLKTGCSRVGGEQVVVGFPYWKLKMLFTQIKDPLQLLDHCTAVIYPLLPALPEGLCLGSHRTPQVMKHN